MPTDSDIIRVTQLDVDKNRALQDLSLKKLSIFIKIKHMRRMFRVAKISLFFIQAQGIGGKLKSLLRLTEKRH